MNFQYINHFIIFPSLKESITGITKINSISRANSDNMISQSNSIENNDRLFLQILVLDLIEEFR